MLLKAGFFTVLITIAFLSYMPVLSAEEFTSCYEWTNKSHVSLDCGEEIIKINSVKHGLSPLPTDTFCHNPSTDPDTDCFDTYQATEVDVFKGCNKYNRCNVPVPFHSVKAKCTKIPEETDGSKYVLVNYECVSNMPSIDMMDYNSDNTNDMSSNTVYLTSNNYPGFVSHSSMCEVTVKENSLLKITVMELHQRRTHNSTCTFELVITDKQSVYSECTQVIWEAPTASNIEFVAQNSDLVVQIALHTDQADKSDVVEGKVWLQLQTFDASNKVVPVSHFESLQCGSQISLWTTTSIFSTAPPSSSVTDAISTASSSQGTTTTPLKTTDVTSRSPLVTTNSTSSDDDKNVSPRKLKENSIMPIIAGVVAGGLVLLVIVIIVIILMVRKHQKNNEPAKQLDVIDAWDNQSVIDAAKKSAQEFKLEEPYDMSRGLSPSLPQNGRPSFHHQTSYSSHNDYAEVPSLPGSKAPSEIGISNKGYECDSYYTGDIDGDIYAQGNKHDNRSLRRKSGSVMKESPPRMSLLYSKPVKKKKSLSGFDNPSWAQNGGPEPRDDTKANEAIYGYTTTLE